MTASATTGTAEQRPITFDEKYKEELGAKTYVWQTIKANFLSVGSMLGGGVVGHYALKAIKPEWNISMLSEATKRIPEIASGMGSALEDGGIISKKLLSAGSEIVRKVNITTGAVAGAFVGMIVHALIQGYQYWKGEESKKLAIREVNEDIANMTAHYRNDESLLHENARLREMLEIEAQKTHVMKLEMEQHKATNTLQDSTISSAPETTGRAIA